MKATVLNRLAMGLAFAGIFVAGVLTLAQIMKREVPCGVGGGCTQVSSHPSAFWLGYPVAYYGLAAYLALAFLAAIRSANGMVGMRTAVLAGLGISAIGTGLSALLTYQALVVIQATCPWCIASAAIMTASLVVHILMMRTPAPAEEEGVDFDFKLMVGLGLLTAIVLIGQTSQFDKPRPNSVMQAELDRIPEAELIPADAHALGNENAPVVIVEFADFLCEACRSSFPRVEELVRNSNSKIRLIFRHLPLYQMRGHEISLSAAVISEAAHERGKFWPFVGAIYGFQEDPGIDDVYDIARALGLDRAKLEQRLQDSQDAIYIPVQRDIGIAKRIMKDLMTPTFVVLTKGGRRYVAHSFDELEVILRMPHFEAAMRQGP